MTGFMSSFALTLCTAQVRRTVFMQILADLHTHTIASGHAYNTILEMIHAAAQKQLPILGISDHAPSMRGTMDEVYFWCFKTIPRYVEGVRVLFGCEMNIMDYKGTIDLSEKALKRLDYTIASLHDLCLPFGTKEENTAAVIGAMNNPYVKIIGHPDDSRYPLDLEAVAKAAKQTHTLLEINNSSLAPDGRLNARENDLILLEHCKHYETPVIIGSDAHFITNVANHGYAISLIKETGFPVELVANTDLDLLASFIPAAKDGSSLT